MWKGEQWNKTMKKFQILKIKAEKNEKREKENISSIIKVKTGRFRNVKPII